MKSTAASWCQLRLAAVSAVESPVYSGICLLLGLVFATGCGEQTAWTTGSGPKEMANSLGMKFVLVSPGEFMMGAAADNPNPASEMAHPQHRVRLTKPFYIGAYEVTLAEFKELMGDRTDYPVPSFFSPSGGGRDFVQDLATERLPIDNVSWNIAEEFCRRLSELPEEVAAGRVYRLPTEAEWEYACRGGTTTAFAFGDELTPAEANINALAAGEDEPKPLLRTAEVGSYQPNPFGLYDMHGNVWEWCLDSSRKYTTATQIDPEGARDFYRVLRGGAWDMPAPYCRSDYRANALAGYVLAGIRVVCETKKPPAASVAKKPADKTNHSGSAGGETSG